MQREGKDKNKVVLASTVTLGIPSCRFSHCIRSEEGRLRVGPS